MFKRLKNRMYTFLIEYIVNNQSRFYRLAYAYVKEKEGALDVVQNAIVKALEKYDTIKNQDAIKTWFYRVLVNEALMYRKKVIREVAYDYDYFLEEVYKEPAYEPGLELYKIIDRLPEQVRELIILHYYEELKFTEISEITGVNVNTVKTRVYSGLEKLKHLLEEESA